MKTLIFALISLTLQAAPPICEDAFDHETIRKIAAFNEKFGGGISGTFEYENKKLVKRNFEYAQDRVYGERDLNAEGALSISIAETNVPVQDWKKIRLLGDDQADLINTGERVHMQDWEMIDRKVLDNFVPEEHNYLKVVIEGEKLKAYEESLRQRNVFHQKVLDRYKEKKGHYLKEEDIKDLEVVDAAYPDQSTLGIMKPSSKRVIHQTDEEIYDNLQATLSIVYSQNNMLSPRFSTSPGRSYNLPLFRRLEWATPRVQAKMEKEFYESGLRTKPWKEIEEIRPEFAAQIEKGYKEHLKNIDMDPQTGFNYASKNINTQGKLTKKIESLFSDSDIFAEFTRFAKFDASDEMYSKLILEGFEQVQREGVTVIMISADSATQRLFRSRFGFKNLGEIETKRLNHINGSEKVETEHIMYMRVGGEEYNKVVETLKERTSRVDQEIIPL